MAGYKEIETESRERIRQLQNQIEEILERMMTNKSGGVMIRVSFATTKGELSIVNCIPYINK